VSVVFSQVYPAVDYSRSVVLAGFKMQYQNIINFNLSIQTPTIDSGATIVVTVGNDTKFQAISVYVLLVGVNSDWVFIQEYQKVGSNQLI